MIKRWRSGKAGLGGSWLASPSITNTPVLSWRVGGFVYLPPAGKLYLKPGLYYVIEMPVNIGFRYGRRRSKYKTFIGSGP